MKTFKDFVNTKSNNMNEDAVNEASRFKGRLDIDMKDGVVSGLSADLEIKSAMPTISVSLRSKYGDAAKVEISCSSGTFANAKDANDFAQNIKTTSELFERIKNGIQAGDDKQSVERMLGRIVSDLKALNITVHVD